jgi:hypothetical protein
MDAIQTSALFNNCAFHVLVPYLASFISAKITNQPDFQFKEIVPNDTHRAIFRQTEGYRYFCEAFKEYYKLPQEGDIGEKVKVLCEKYSHPLDLQVLLGPVLRVVLGKVLQNNPVHKQNLKPSFEALINSCITRLLQDTRAVGLFTVDTVALLLSEMSFDEDEYEELFKPNIQNVAKVIVGGTGITVDSIWDQAYDNYCRYQADPSECVHVSSDQLFELCKSFNLDFNFIDVPDISANATPSALGIVDARLTNNDHWEIVNKSNSHWEHDYQSSESKSAFKIYHNSGSAILSLGFRDQIGTIQNIFKDQINRVITLNTEFHESQYIVLPANDWANNSGLDQLSDLIVNVVMGNTQLEIESTPGQTLRFENTIGFERFLSVFSEYYHLENASTSDSRIQGVKRLLTAYTLAQERLMIITPVLRQMLDPIALNSMIPFQALEKLHSYFGVALKIFIDLEREKVSVYDQVLESKPESGSFKTFSLLLRGASWHSIKLDESQTFEHSHAIQKYTSILAFGNEEHVTEERLQTLQVGLAEYLNSGIPYVENNPSMIAIGIDGARSELLNAILEHDANKVKDLIMRGDNWREQVTLTIPTSQNVLNLELVPKTASCLEVAACTGDRKIVTLILQHTVPGRDDNLVQRAYEGACNFRRTPVLPAFLNYTVKHSSLALLNAVTVKDLSLFQTLTTLGAPFFPDLNNHLIIVRFLRDFWLEKSNDIEFVSAFQELLLMALYKSKLSQSSVTHQEFELSEEALKVFDEAYLNNASWMKHFIATLDTLSKELPFEQTQLESMRLTVYSLLEKVAIKSCEAISIESKEELTKCLSISTGLIYINGRHSPLHHAYQRDKLNFLKETLLSYISELNGIVSGENPELEQQLRSRVDSDLNEAAKSVRDQFARTLEFRLQRKLSGEQLNQRIASSSYFGKILLSMLRIKHVADNAAIFVSDRVYERAVQASKVQSTRTYNFLYYGQLVVRTIPDFVAYGHVRAGLNVLKTVLPYQAKNQILNVARAASRQVGPLIGWDKQTAERIFPTVLENSVYFFGNPGYYVLSTSLGLGCYYSFKDSGHTNLEAIAQFTLDNISYNLVLGTDTNVPIDERFLYRLNNNLSPILGANARDWVIPGIVAVHNAANQWNIAVNYPVEALKPYANSQFLYQSLVSLSPTLAELPLAYEKIDAIVTPGVNYIKDSAAQLNTVFHQSLMDLNSYLSILPLENLNTLSNEQLKKFIDPISNKFEEVMASGALVYEQSKSLLGQYPTYQEYILNCIEKSILDSMEDSIFKSERLHVLQMFETNCLGISVSALENALDEATKQGDAQAIEAAQKAFDSQNALLTEAKAVEQSLFKQTEGFSYFEKWQSAYTTLKNNEFDKLLTPAEMDAFRAAESQARAESVLHNSDFVNRMGEDWAQAVDHIFKKNAANITDNTNWVHVIQKIYTDALILYSDRSQIAKYIADETIRFKYPLYPDTGDKVAIEADRQKMIKDLYDSELDHFDSKKEDRRERCYNRLYDYIEAAISNTKKKHHVHRWKRMYVHFEQKFWKPLANEFCYVMSFKQWYPYKHYPIGFPHRRGAGSGANISIQINYSSKPGLQIQAVSSGKPFATLYNSNKQSKLEFTMQTLRQDFGANSVTKDAKKTTQATLEQPKESMGLSLSVSANPGMSMDNPYIRSALAEQYKDIFEFGHREAEKEELKTAQSKSKSKSEAPVRRSQRLAAKASEPTPVVATSKPIAQSEVPRSEGLTGTVMQKAVIGTGRALVKTGQGLEQMRRILGEKMGLVDKGSAAEYTRQINEEARLYDSTPIGQSKVAKTAEIATEIGLLFAVPEATAAKGAKFVASLAASGAVLGAAKPTEEGTLAAHAKNAGVEAGISVAAGAAGKAVLHAYSEGKKVASSFTEKVLTTPAPKKGAAAGSAGTTILPYNANSRSFTPAFNQIESFSIKGTLDGALYPKDKLTLLVNYLEKRGTYVYGTNGAPRFVGRENGPSQIYLPENPTILQVKHELSHWLDFKNLGYEKYSKLTVYQRENMVLERLQENRIWSGLNQFEKEFSLNYVEKIKHGYKPGVRCE